MKVIFIVLSVVIFASCHKSQVIKTDDQKVLLLDSTSFEDYTTGKWTVPYHPTISGYEPLSGALSLYGYFSNQKPYTLISQPYKFSRYVTVKFLYKMYTRDNLVNGRVSVSFNNKEYVQQPLLHSSVQSFNQTFEIMPEQEGKITIDFLQDAEAGKNIWVDNVVILTRSSQ
jgi:hypothetical protein